jgi:tetratricopeptide (TPR) repeat protein
VFEDLLTECTVAVAAPGCEGSGFFVAPGLVVTAAHVVRATEPCSVTWRDESFPGTVLDRCPDVEVTSGPYPLPDVAVIEVPDAPAHPWVEFEWSNPRSGERGDRLFAVGYTRRYDADRLSLTPFSYTSEGVFCVDGVDLVQIRDGLVVPRMSGAPVLNQRTGRVIGHLKRTSDDRVPTGGWVVHCRSWLDQVCAVRERHEAVRHRDRRWRDARARLLEPHLQRASQAPPSGDFPPSAALAPEYGLVDFTGRGGDLAELHAWCNDVRDFDVRLLIGPGGVGKSRLAAELCAQRQTAGWISGILDPAAPHTILADVRANGDAALVVIDYAESRSDLGELLRRAADIEAGAPLRVLLLARGTSEWWEDLREAPQRRVRDAVLRNPPKTLGTRLNEDRTLDEIVADAVRCFARELSRPRPEVPPLPPEAAGWPVLSLHVWSLLAVLLAGEAGPTAPPPATSAALWQELLGHEARYWRATARRADLTALDMTTLRRCVGLVALLGTTSEQQTVQALTRVPELSDADELLRHRVARWLRDVYPGQPSEWLGRLAPDVLAEHHVVEQLSVSPEFAHRALTALPTNQSVHALTVLGRGVVHQPEAAALITTALHANLARLALPALEAARRTGPRLGRLLARAVASSASPLLLDELAHQTPPRSEALRDLRILLLRRQLAAARTGSLNEVKLQIELGRLLVLVGDAAEAHRLARAALGTLDRHRGGVGRAERARAFVLLGEALNALGHTSEALEANAGAVALFRGQLAAELIAEPVQFADALILRSYMLLNVEEPADAEATAREAIARLEARPSSSPAWRLAMARTQVSLSQALWRMDRHEEDLASIRSAVATLRTLASLDSDQHLSELGVALDQLGVRLSELNQREEAMAHSREAVQIFRKLTRDNPVLYSNVLACALHNFAVRLGGDHDRNEEALEVAQEAVDLRRRLAHGAPAIARLVRSLLNLGSWHERLGHRDASLAAVEEAVGLCRQLDTDGDGRFARDVGWALQTLATQRAKEAPDAALELAEEAVALLRSAQETHSERDRSMLARALGTVARIHVTREDLAAAIGAYEEAAKLWLELAEEAPQANAAKAGQALEAILLLKETSGAPAVSAADAERAAAWIVGAVRRCDEMVPGCATAVLARALRVDAHRASEAGQHENALEAAAEAVALAREASGAVAGTGRMAAELLPGCLYIFAEALLAADRRFEAIEALTECIQVGLPADRGDGHMRQAMSRSLGFLGQVELSVGRYASAAEHLSAAIGWLAEMPNAGEEEADGTRPTLFDASDHCLRATAKNAETGAAIACAVLALATCDGAPEERVDACLQELRRVVTQAPTAATAAWHDVVGEDLPSLLVSIAHRPPAVPTDAEVRGTASTERERVLVDIARQFATAAARVVADGERVVVELRREPAPDEPLAVRLARLLVHAERLGLRCGLRRTDLVRLALEQYGGQIALEAEVDAAIAYAITATMLREVGDRVRLTPYLAAAASWCADISAPAPDIGIQAVALADPEDLLNIAAEAEAAGLDDVADTALARGVELGVGGATHNLAFRLHEQGKVGEARMLYEQAAAMGVTESMIAVGSLLAAREEFDAAERLLRTAANRGHPRGMASLAGLLGATGRESEARRWAQLAAERGDAIGMCNLGRLEIAAGNPQGEHWLNTAAVRGSVTAMRSVGEHLLTTDPAQGEDWLRRAASAGDLMAASRLCEYLLQQSRDFDDELVRSIAESTDVTLGPNGGEILLPVQLGAYAHLMRVTSMLELSERALSKDDLHVARAWLERALRAQIPRQVESIAERVIGVLDRKCDLTDMWLTLAEAGDGAAMYNLGLLFWRKEQLEDAERWWRRGADAGDAECYNKVGVMRLSAGDSEEADRWFRRGADHGDPVAMFNVGALAHECGAAEEAALWFRRAQEAGYERAAGVLQQLASDDDA